MGMLETNLRTFSDVLIPSHYLEIACLIRTLFQVREVQDRNKPNCFELYATSTDFIKACKTDSEGKVVEGKHTVYRMSAATPDEKEEWIKCIR